MTLDQIYSENYVLSDGEILSIHFDNQNGSVVKIIISTRQYFKKDKYRKCKLLLTLTQIVELNLFDNSDILGNYSDITISKLENGNYYISFAPYGNTNEQHPNDNNIFIANNIDFIELEESETLFTMDTFSEEESFWIMWYFLEGHYELSGGQFDVSDILSACQPFEFDKNGHFDGLVKGNRRIAPADSGMIWHWKEAIKKYRQQGRPNPTPLKK